MNKLSHLFRALSVADGIHICACVTRSCIVCGRVPRPGLPPARVAQATLWFADKYYSKPVDESDILAVARMTSFIKQVCMPGGGGGFPGLLTL